MTPSIDEIIRLKLGHHVEVRGNVASRILEKEKCPKCGDAILCAFFSYFSMSSNWYFDSCHVCMNEKCDYSVEDNQTCGDGGGGAYNDLTACSICHHPY